MLDLLVAAVLVLAPSPPYAGPDVAPAVLDAVKWVESRGHWFARSPRGRHVGAYQAAVAFARVPMPLLYLEPVARWEARRHLRVRLRQAGGDLSRALAAYRCGNDGLAGLCGATYAAAVLCRAGRGPCRT
jgi:hypothetical protein